MHCIVSGLYQWRHVRKSANFAQKTRLSGIFNNEKATTHDYCQAKIKFCMHAVDIRHQESLGSIVIVWPTCTL